MPAEALRRLLDDAAEVAVRLLDPRGPLLPFAMVEDADGRALARPMADTLENMLAEVRGDVAGRAGAQRAVVIWDGELEFSGRLRETLHFELHEAGSSGELFALPYRRVGLVRRRIRAEGRPVRIEGDRPPLIG